MFLKYFCEIKNRVVLVCFSWIFTLLVSYLNKEILLFLCIKPIIFLFNGSSFYFIATNLTDIFSTYVDLAYLMTISLTFIVICYHFLGFFNPALYIVEAEIIKFFSIVGIVLWLLSLQALHYIVLPFTLSFFLSFQNSSCINSVNIFLEARIIDYISLYISSYWVLTLTSQIFLIFFSILSTLKNQLRFIKNTRKIFYLIFFLVATFLTPPDVGSQIFLGVSFVVIYELLIVITIFKSECF